jgi:hypothetical protein
VVKSIIAETYKIEGIEDEQKRIERGLAVEDP